MIGIVAEEVKCHNPLMRAFEIDLNGEHFRIHVTKSCPQNYVKDIICAELFSRIKEYIKIEEVEPSTRTDRPSDHT